MERAEIPVAVAALEEELGQALPPAYTEFLEIMAEGYFSGDYLWTPDSLATLDGLFNDIREQDGSGPLPQGAFVFFGWQDMHFAFFDPCDGAEDPMVTDYTSPAGIVGRTPFRRWMQELKKAEQVEMPGTTGKWKEAPAEIKKLVKLCVKEWELADAAGGTADLGPKTSEAGVREALERLREGMEFDLGLQDAIRVRLPELEEVDLESLTPYLRWEHGAGGLFLR